MVANQTQSVVNNQNYELTQQNRDAKSAIIGLKFTRDGRTMNLEIWRKSIDIALGLMNGNHYLNPNQNICLETVYDLKQARAEVQAQETTQFIKPKRTTHNSKTKQKKTKIKQETYDSQTSNQKMRPNKKRKMRRKEKMIMNLIRQMKMNLKMNMMMKEIQIWMKSI